MDVFQQMEIRNYFNLDEHIEVIKGYIQELELSFYNQSFLPQTISNGDELVHIGFNIEKNVVLYLDTVQDSKDVVNRLSMKKRYFNEYLETLSKVDREYLINKYIQGVCHNENRRCEKSVYSEILEIEEAANFKYGFPVDVNKNIFNKGESLMENVQNTADALGV